MQVRDGYSVAGFDMTRPQCRSYMDDPAIIQEYENDGREDDHVTEQFVREFLLCGEFGKAWGISNVYCMEP